MQGRILQVSTRDTGSSLVNDYAGDETEIVVADSRDFNEFGGDQIEIEGFTYEVLERLVAEGPDGYDVLVLTTGLMGPVDGGTTVYVLPKSQYKVALVQIENDEIDPPEITVPFEMQAVLEEGIREPDYQEGVTIGQGDYGDYTILSVVNKTPVYGAEYVDVEAGSSSDGIPPAASPSLTLTALVGTLVGRWGAQPNADLVGYDVYVQPSDGQPGKVDTVYSLSAQISREPGGGPLRKGIDYTVWVHAFDVDGYAPTTGAPGTARVTTIDPFDIPDFSLSVRKFQTATHEIY